MKPMQGYAYIIDMYHGFPGDIILHFLMNIIPIEPPIRTEINVPRRSQR